MECSHTSNSEDPTYAQLRCEAAHPPEESDSESIESEARDLVAFLMSSTDEHEDLQCKFRRYFLGLQRKTSNNSTLVWMVIGTALTILTNEHEAALAAADSSVRHQYVVLKNQYETLFAILGEDVSFEEIALDDTPQPMTSASIARGVILNVLSDGIGLKKCEG